MDQKQLEAFIKLNPGALEVIAKSFSDMRVALVEFHKAAFDSLTPIVELLKEMEKHEQLETRTSEDPTPE